MLLADKNGPNLLSRWRSVTASVDERPHLVMPKLHLGNAIVGAIP